MEEKYGETCGGRKVAISCNMGKVHGDGLSHKRNGIARYKRGKCPMGKAGIRVWQGNKKWGYRK